MIARELVNAQNMRNQYYNYLIFQLIISVFLLSPLIYRDYLHLLNYINTFVIRCMDYKMRRLMRHYMQPDQDLDSVYTEMTSQQPKLSDCIGKITQDLKMNLIATMISGIRYHEEHYKKEQENMCWQINDQILNDKLPDLANELSTFNIKIQSCKVIVQNPYQFMKLKAQDRSLINLGKSLTIEENLQGIQKAS